MVQKVGRRARRQSALALALVTLATGACANLWGFDELQAGGVGGTSGAGGSSGVSGNTSGNSCTDASPCPVGCRSCDTGCTDLSSDPQNCGACGTICSSGRSCSNGECICPADHELCDGTCFDVQNDVKHCGGCDVVCDDGGLCKSGVCSYATVLGAVPGIPGGFALADSRLYWGVEGTIYSVSVDGGDTSPVTAGNASAHGLIVRGGEIYWRGGQLASAPLTGGDSQVLTEQAGNGPLTSDEQYLYWPDQTTGNVYRLPLEGGDPVVLSDNSSGNAIAVDATGVYFSGFDAVYRTPLDGGSRTELATPDSTPALLKIVGSKLYYTADTLLYSHDLTTNAGDVVPIGQSGDFAVDGDLVYYIGQLRSATGVTTLAVNRIALDGTGMTTLALADQPQELLIDATNVYWLDSGPNNISSSVRKISK